MLSGFKNFNNFCAAIFRENPGKTRQPVDDLRTLCAAVTTWHRHLTQKMEITILSIASPGVLHDAIKLSDLQKQSASWARHNRQLTSLECFNPEFSAKPEFDMIASTYPYKV